MGATDKLFESGTAITIAPFNGAGGGVLERKTSDWRKSVQFWVDRKFPTKAGKSKCTVCLPDMFM